jgi:hypothetical protein
MHARCARVVTKETLTRELGRMLTDGIGRGDETTAGAAPAAEKSQKE